MRLIDADKINSKDVIMGNSEFANDIRKAMQDLIDSQPVAYYVDKVIEKIVELQLKAQEKFYNVEDKEFATMLRGQLRGIADCLEIVKAGGINE